MDEASSEPQAAAGTPQNQTGRPLSPAVFNLPMILLSPDLAQTILDVSEYADNAIPHPDDLEDGYAIDDPIWHRLVTTAREALQIHGQPLGGKSEAELQAELRLIEKKITFLEGQGQGRCEEPQRQVGRELEFVIDFDRLTVGKELMLVHNDRVVILTVKAVNPGR